MKLNTGRVLMCAALSMILGLGSLGPTNAALFGLWKSRKKPDVVARHSLIVFPFDQGNVTRVPTTFGEYVASDLRYVLSESDRFSVLLYKDRLAPIARALADQTLRPADTTPPFSEERDKPLKLARLLASDLYLVGSVDDFQVDTAKKVAVITLSAQLVDAKTGRLVKTLLVTGRTPEGAATADEDELRDVAKGDAVTKLSAEILAPKKTAEPAVEASTPVAAPAETTSPPAADSKPAEKPKDQPAKPPAK